MADRIGTRVVVHVTDSPIPLTNLHRISVLAMSSAIFSTERVNIPV
ncbi:hypothetical protein M5E89_13100 [Acidaminococcus intestini]|nr:hypothetical protein M5E89_13100 [Acidaminococcus intestini]